MEKEIYYGLNKELDGLCQNSLFWNALINKEITSYMRFKIKISNSVLLLELNQMITVSLQY